MPRCALRRCGLPAVFAVGIGCVVLFGVLSGAHGTATWRLVRIHVASTAVVRVACSSATGVRSCDRSITRSIYRLYADSVARLVSSQGQGSGFVVSRSGYLLTSASLLRQDWTTATTVRVTFRAGAGRTLTVAGHPVSVDTSAGVAVLKVEAQYVRDRRPVPVNVAAGVDSDDAVAVIAVSSEKVDDCAGGPLFDASGRAVGVCTSSAAADSSASSGGWQGCGNAVSLRAAAKTLRSLGIQTTGCSLEEALEVLPD